MNILVNDQQLTSAIDFGSQLVKIVVKINEIQMGVLGIKLVVGKGKFKIRVNVMGGREFEKQLPNSASINIPFNRIEQISSALQNQAKIEIQTLEGGLKIQSVHVFISKVS